MVGKNDKVRGFRADLSKEDKTELYLFPPNYELQKHRMQGPNSLRIATSLPIIIYMYYGLNCTPSKFIY